MSKLTIPDKHYVGMTIRHGSKMPLGFITPWGEDAAAKKRMGTVDQWAAAGKPGSLPTMTIENTPMLGFKMSGDIRRGQQGAQDKWRIEDPRGFELEVTSENLAMILLESTIEKGEIQSQCVWARDGGNNRLLPVDCEEYKEAVRMTKISSSTGSWKDVKQGNRIVLQNGVEGIYLGKFYIAAERYVDRSDEVSTMLETMGNPVHAILADDVPDNNWKQWTTTLHLISSPKLSGIVSADTLTPAEAEIKINECLNDRKCMVQRGNGYRDSVLASLSKFAPADWTLTVEPTLDVTDPWKEASYDNAIYVRMKDGTVGRVQSRHHTAKTEITVLREDLLPSGIFANKTIKVLNQGYAGWGYGGRGTTVVYNDVTLAVDPNDVAEILYLHITLNTKAGNQIKNRIR